MSPMSAMPYVIAKARDPRQQPFAFQHAQRVARGEPCVAVLFAEAGKRRDSAAGLQYPVGELLTQNRGQTYISPWIG
jgi:hypothetical protein